jgi:hypothetical protein
MTRNIWQSDKIPGIGVSQVPLILAWALTIHKSQGATLDAAEIDVGSGIFECGQTYVALSRVKNLNGLYLTSFDASKIRINRKVKEFYDNLNQQDLIDIWQNILPSNGTQDKLNIKLNPGEQNASMRIDSADWSKIDSLYDNIIKKYPEYELKDSKTNLELKLGAGSSDKPYLGSVIRAMKLSSVASALADHSKEEKDSNDNNYIPKTSLNEAVKYKNITSQDVDKILSDDSYAVESNYDHNKSRQAVDQILGSANRMKLKASDFDNIDDLEMLLFKDSDENQKYILKKKNDTWSIGKV